MKKLIFVLLVACAMGCQEESEMRPETTACFECTTFTSVNRNDGYATYDTEETDVHCGITAAQAKYIELKGSATKKNFSVVTTIKTTCK